MFARTPRSGSAPGRAAGFSLVELMVAVVIGLIGTIVIFQVFGVSESQRRTTVGIGDAQQNGLLALFSIERDARMAGYGINHPMLIGCTVVGYDAGPPVRDPISFRMAAAQIADGAAGAPDSLTFMFGSSSLLMAPARLVVASNTGSTVHRVDSPFGFRVGDLVIAAEAGKNCSLRQVTEIPTTGQTDRLIHNAPARYNGPGGLGIDYAAWDNATQSGGMLYNIGAAPAVVSYSVQNAQLMFQNLLLGGAGTPIAEGIVQLQALYGKDDGTPPGTADDGIVDRWEASMPPVPTATDWARVIAIRVAVVARSVQPERPGGGPACTTTTAEPTWFGGTITLAADPDWRCYRYRVFETTVPIRNLIWRPT